VAKRMMNKYGIVCQSEAQSFPSMCAMTKMAMMT
jgi:hypothetical protein